MADCISRIADIYIIGQRQTQSRVFARKSEYCCCCCRRRRRRRQSVAMIYDVNSPLFRSFLSQKGGGASDKRYALAFTMFHWLHYRNSFVGFRAMRFIKFIFSLSSERVLYLFDFGFCIVFVLGLFIFSAFVLAKGKVPRIVDALIWLHFFFSLKWVNGTIEYRP